MKCTLMRNDAKISDLLLSKQREKRKGDLKTLGQLIQLLTRLDLSFLIPLLVNYRVMQLIKHEYQVRTLVL